MNNDPSLKFSTTPIGTRWAWPRRDGCFGEVSSVCILEEFPSRFLDSDQSRFLLFREERVRFEFSNSRLRDVPRSKGQGFPDVLVSEIAFQMDGA